MWYQGPAIGTGSIHFDCTKPASLENGLLWMKRIVEH